MMKKLPVGEDFLHYIWRLKKLPSARLLTTTGKTVEILDFGTYNRDAGPDFFNARILMDGQVWAGNIEMHLNSRDWYRHRHQNDRAYDNVILHVVYEEDGDVTIEDQDRTVPTVALKGCIPRVYVDNYQKLMSAPNEKIPCAQLIQRVQKETVHLMKYRLMTERLEQKTALVAEIHRFTNFNWEETLYLMVARYFGARVNVQPFEMLAKSIPYALILRNKDRPDILEALFLGQAGMLLAPHKDDHYVQLQKEYAYQKRKYALHPMDPVVWKFGKMRPVNFPTVRVALLAVFTAQMQGLFSEMLVTKDWKILRSRFEVTAPSYWDHHYHFGEEAPYLPKRVGRDLADIILLNAVSPVLFYYGMVHQDEHRKMMALELGVTLDAENNTATRMWTSLGVAVENAFDSQALLQLFQQYCTAFRCLSCSIGNAVMQDTHEDRKPVLPESKYQRQQEGDEKCPDEIHG